MQKTQDNTVSVIIPTYNAASYILETIDSVLQQTYPIEEIIVVDDGSTDETRQILAPYSTTNKIRYYYKENGGPASARNFGIAQARGTYIAFIDADDLWTPQKIAFQITQSSSDTIVYSRRFFIHSQKEDPSPLFGGSILPNLIKNNCITNSSVLIPRSIIAQVGPFNESRELIGLEDYEYWVRSAALNYKFTYCDAALVGYREHTQSISKRQSLKSFVYLYACFIFRVPYSLIPQTIFYGTKLCLYKMRKIIYN